MKYFEYKYKGYKSKLKARYYELYDTIKERLQYQPPKVSKDEWRQLVHFSSSEKAKIR